MSDGIADAVPKVSITFLCLCALNYEYEDKVEFTQWHSLFITTFVIVLLKIISRTQIILEAVV